MKTLTLKDLAVDHDYYANDSNYYSKDRSYYYETWADFCKVMWDADTDMNLVYRWDVHESDDKYWMQIFIIGQRKGLYIVSTIETVTEDDVPTIVEYLNRSWNKLNNIWKPLS